MILKENDGCAHMDKIIEVSIRPPELVSCFDQVGNYFRWLIIYRKSPPKGDILKLLCDDIVIGRCKS